MLWMFERGEEAVRLETRFDNVSGDYVLVVVRSDERVETERFGDPSAFQARLQELEQQLAADCWTQVGGPAVLRDGWRL